MLNIIVYISYNTIDLIHRAQLKGGYTYMLICPTLPPKIKIIESETSLCPYVGRGCRAVVRLVGHKFIKGRRVSLPCSYRSTFVKV